MPRPKKIVSQDIVEQLESSSSQEIVAPLIDANETVGAEVEKTEKSFERPLKKFGVYRNGEFLMEVDENSELINFYLSENKSELENRILAINEKITDPDVLIFFHEGKQNRLYMSFEAYYSQNGLAPKLLTMDTWAKYYHSVNPLLTDEEIALHKFGDLPYSFVILESEE